MKFNRFILPCLFLLALYSCGVAYAGTTTNVTLGHRAYAKYIPTTPVSPMPLVVVMHPGLSNATAWQQNAQDAAPPGLNYTMDGEAEQHGFAVVYLNGIGRVSGFNTWNARDGKCCGFAMQRHSRDLEYIKRVITDMSQTEDIDETRIYFAGYSNGAMMAQSYACKYQNDVDGMVLVAGPLMLDQDECNGFDTGNDFPDIPVTYIYGTVDTTVPPAGGVGVADSTIFPATADGIAYRSTSGATQTVYPLVGANHAWDDIVTYLSSQEGLVFASVTGDLAD